MLAEAIAAQQEARQVFAAQGVALLLGKQPLMLSRRPQSALTTSAAPEPFSAAVLSCTIAPEMSGMRTLKLPPKPQHSLSWSCSTRSTPPAAREQRAAMHYVFISRRAEQEVCSASLTGAPVCSKRTLYTSSRNSASLEGARGQRLDPAAASAASSLEQLEVG